MSSDHKYRDNRAHLDSVFNFGKLGLGENNINIVSYLNESNGNVGYNIIDLETEIPEKLVKEIEANPDVIRTRAINY